MSHETLRELVGTLREEQQKYTYFLLAAAGAAIGLAVNQTQTAALGWDLLLLGVGVSCWGLSFFLGCRYLEYLASTLYSNATLIQVQMGEHPRTGTHPGLIAAASEGIRSAMESNSNRANYLGHWQVRMLIIGALFYLAWHIQGMYLRAASAFPMVGNG